ncbi:FT-interacting protein 3-like [Nicotiana tomentosiformis]|uniref:FT-interacting protein 3-like n=1 Tax=Nicotiana tomentosiformis TaxID=4098 RepID=UPI00051C020A|nr:FT-interacting protein 3-like [Nicotiana tomentosiformis]
MEYLYVRVVKARDLPTNELTGSLDPYVEVRLGDNTYKTRHFEKTSNPEWNQTFAFSQDRIQASVLEVTVKDKYISNDDFVGRLMFDLCCEIPKMVPPENLVPQWYRLKDRSGSSKVNGELLLALWMGAPADETFPEAWHSDAFAVSSADVLANVRSKVYLLPKLWYLRVNVIEVQDLTPSDMYRIPLPQVFVKAILGIQTCCTKVSTGMTINPFWNEDLMFVAAEPFDQLLILTVEDKVSPNKDEVLGRFAIPLSYVDMRLDEKPVTCKWYELEKQVKVDGEKKKKVGFASKILMRICLEGGYHVLDESTCYSSDLRPTAKQLCKSSIGVLELGILNAQGLKPMKRQDGQETTDAYCVAKYGQKWVGTRTITDSLSPTWNEHYTWEVFDPCTVITIGVFDNCRPQGGDKSEGAKDSRIGKVRIRLSTLETGRVYTHSYPLMLFDTTGLRKTGEICLTMRFICSSSLNMTYMYSQPLLPKMHYLRRLAQKRVDDLRHHAQQIVIMRLSRADPSLGKEVVEYMFDEEYSLWSIRKSRVNIFRLMGILEAVAKRFDQICNWRNPITTFLIHIMFIILVLNPNLILPAFFLSLSVISLWNYKWRPVHPSLTDTSLSCADTALKDELSEEFDSFPTSFSSGIVSMRYDRLRMIAGRIQTVVGDWATQGERLLSLRSWRDPRATAVLVIFCLVAAIVVYITPFQVLVLFTGFYTLRHPWLRFKLPSMPLNFFQRLPTRRDCML